MRTLDISKYDFRWLGEQMVQKKLTVTMAAKKINKSTSSIYNWLTGCYLTDAINRPNQKDDVAKMIAEMLDYNVEDVREQIRLYLLSAGKISTVNDVSNYRSELAIFIDKVKNIHYYDNEKTLSSEQRTLIRSVLTVLDNI